MRIILVAACATLTAWPANAMDAWRDWFHQSRRLCPSHHVDWICNDCYLNLTEGFDRTLTVGQVRRVERIADVDHRCANVEGGFGCITSSEFYAYDRLGLMPRFVRFSCKAVKCEELVDCSRLPPGP